jgi:hypothetical protein
MVQAIRQYAYTMMWLTLAAAIALAAAVLD